jgi:hypothetical protein
MQIIRITKIVSYVPAPTVRGYPCILQTTPTDPQNFQCIKHRNNIRSPREEVNKFIGVSNEYIRGKWRADSQNTLKM